MKVLSMNLHFLLPDDFDGTFNDALLEIVKYRKENNKPDFPDRQIDLNTKDYWNAFLREKDKGFKLCGGAFLGEWDETTFVWKRLNDK